MALILGCFCGLVLGALSYVAFDLFLGHGAAIAIGAMVGFTATLLFAWAFS